MYLAPKLEFSPDPLSDTTPTWVDVTTYLQAVAWGNGSSSDLDQAQAGTASFRLKNRHRDFEPEYQGGRFAGNILPMRRFRWTVTADGATYAQGVWYATNWQLDYPDPSSAYSTVTVDCVDGVALLALATLPSLDPPSSETYADVVAYDNPYAHYPLDEISGRKLGATVGPEGQYKKSVGHGYPAVVVGESGQASLFSLDGYARALLDDVGVWNDSGQVSCEIVVQKSGTPNVRRRLVQGPWDTPSLLHSFALTIESDDGVAASVTNVGQVAVSAASSPISNGTHHLAMTYDGSALRLYVDGLLAAQKDGIGNIINPDAGEALYIGASPHDANTDFTPIVLGHAAVYDYAVSADRVAAHADAALNRGYPQASAGTRIAAIATHPLWSTAGIPAGQIVVTPRMQVGQTRIDEIVEAARAETPLGRFYFDDVGNPAYLPFDAIVTPLAVFGDAAGEIPYDSLDLDYDDQLYNQATVTRDGGLAQTRTDVASIAAYGGVRAHDETGLIISRDTDAQLIAQTIIDEYAQPLKRVAVIGLNGSDQRARTQILSRQVGDAIRVRRRGEGGTPSVDVITRIIGRQKTLDVHGDLRCTWSLARGFDASQQAWRVGVTGYSEVGVTTVLG